MCMYLHSCVQSDSNSHITDVSVTTHVARSIRITLRYGGLLCYGAGSPGQVKNHSRLKGGAIVYVLSPTMSRDPPHRSLLGRLPRSTVTPPPSQGSYMDIALTCYPAADYRVRQGGRCLRRIHSTGPHVITCPVTKPRIVSATDVSRYHASSASPSA